MLAIIFQEKLQRFLNLYFGGPLAQRTANQQGRAVAHVRIHALVIQGAHAHMRARGVDGMRKVQFGIDQRSIEIENQQIHIRAGYAAPVFFLRGCAARAIGLRLTRVRAPFRAYSTIFRCSVLR